jgi:hypothetical protein
MQTDTQHALCLLREDPQYLNNARAIAPVGNSLAGSILAMKTVMPRHAGQMVREDGPEYQAGGRTMTGRETLIVDRAHFEHVVTLLRYVAANLSETEAASADLVEDSADLLEEARLG